MFEHITRHIPLEHITELPSVLDWLRSGCRIDQLALQQLQGVCSSIINSCKWRAAQVMLLMVDLIDAH